MTMMDLVPPQDVARAMKRMRKDEELGVGIRLMETRAAAFSSPMAAMLAGIAAHAPARAHFDAMLDSFWAAETLARPERAAKNAGTEELVIGGGIHAAIYAAVRVRMGFPKPIVVDAGTAGGAFAVSRGPAFYLNSRNRPGALGVPGRDGALNVLPGGIVQPADLSGDEFQRNSDLAFAVRSTLAMSAHVMTGTRVLQVRRALPGAPRQLEVQLDSGPDGEERVFAGRVIRATGLGAPRALNAPADGDRILSFSQFMGRMDTDFPLRGMRRVAVIGQGDSGKTVLEALLGQGPVRGMSVASLDTPDVIDWYGPGDTTTREDFISCNRSRYRGIARFLPRGEGGDENARIRPMGRAAFVNAGFEQAFVDERPYDCVVYAIGFEQERVSLPSGEITQSFPVTGRPVARRGTGEEEVYAVGPCANLTVTQTERNNVPVLGSVPENATAIFRLAGRTAALASALPGVERRTEKAKRPGVMITDLRTDESRDSNGKTVITKKGREKISRAKAASQVAFYEQILKSGSLPTRGPTDSFSDAPVEVDVVGVKDGSEFRVGDRVTVGIRPGDAPQGVILGFTEESQEKGYNGKASDRIAIDLNGRGGYTFKGRPVYGASLDQLGPVEK